MKKTSILFFLLIFLTINSPLKSQNISSEKINFYQLQSPEIPIEAANRAYGVTVNSPYNLSKEDVEKKSREDFEKEKLNYENVVAESKVKYQESLKNYDNDVKLAKERFEAESAAFKKLSLLERLTLTEKGQNPKLQMPEKPEYRKPQPPVYREPNLSNYFIVDNAVLASQIKIDGFQKGNPYVDINIDMQQVNFQDNAGQSYANQPTNLKIKVNGQEKVNESIFNDFEFISSSSTDNINKVSEERNVMNKTISGLNKIINNYFGFQKVSKTVTIESVKNKGSYDDLEKANIYVTTNLKKLQGNPDSGATEAAFANMQKGIDIWNATLKKINYNDPKAEFNSKIARYIYFNLIRLNVALGNKTEAEKYLNEFQEHLVDIKLDSYEKSELDRLEKEIYKSK